MDLITFNKGIEGVQPLDHNYSQPQLPQEKSFIPLGQSIEQHTGTLFDNESLNSERLNALAEPETRMSIDSDTFSDLIRDTLTSVNSIAKTRMMESGQQEKITFQQAIKVIGDLDADRQLLLTHLQALNRV